jgi:hypothetical protein
MLIRNVTQKPSYMYMHITIVPTYETLRYPYGVPVPVDPFCRVLFFLITCILSYVSFSSSNLSGSTVISYFNSSQVRLNLFFTSNLLSFFFCIVKPVPMIKICTRLQIQSLPLFETSYEMLTLLRLKLVKPAGYN